MARGDDNKAAYDPAQVVRSGHPRRHFGEEGATQVGKYIKGATDRDMQKILALVEEAEDTEAVSGIDWLAGTLFTEFYDPFAKQRGSRK